MTATPDVRWEESDHRTGQVRRSGEQHGPASAITAPASLRTVTPDQVDRAVLQLRERRGRPAAEQMQAVLRALELTVEPLGDHRH